MGFEPTHPFFKLHPCRLFFTFGIFCFVLWSYSFLTKSKINARNASLKIHVRKMEGISQNSF